MANSTRNYFRRLAEGYEDGPLSKVLSPVLEMAGGAYGCGVGTLRGLYEKKILKSTQLPFPVISVGNVTWGGTGKTPFVEYLARRIGETGKTALILTRGYSHDEVEQMRAHLPKAVIGIGANRISVAREISAKQKIDVAILDDGLQHWPVHRDMEIVLVNALNPFGNYKLIPRGILREPLSVLGKASLVVISHANLVPPKQLTELKDEIRKYAPKAQLVESYLDPLFFYRARKKARVPLVKLENQRVTTFSGVGMPRSFQLLLTRHHIRPIRNFEFTGHHVFSKQELQEIKSVSDSASATEIITTEKDFYRAPEMISDVINPLVLAAKLRISSGEDVLNRKIFELTGGSNSK